jgi:hypothetical protein
MTQYLEVRGGAFFRLALTIGSLIPSFQAIDKVIENTSFYCKISVNRSMRARKRTSSMVGIRL